MEIELNPQSVTDFVTIVIALFGGLHFITLTKENRRANLMLGLYLIQVAFSVFATQVEFFGEDPTPGFLLYLPISSAFFPMVLLLFYTFAHTNQWQPESKRWRWLFLPGLLEIGLRIGLAINPELLGEAQDSYHLFIFLTNYVSIPFNLFVLYRMVVVLNLHKRRLPQLFSNLEDKRLNWLRWLVLVHLAFNVIWLVDDTTALLANENQLSEFIADISLFATLVTVCWIVSMGMRQRPIFLPEPLRESVSPPEAIAEPTSESTQQTPDPIDQTRFQELVAYVEKEAPYRNPDLSLKQLADALSIRDKELSRLINQQTGNNFYHFINSYRVEAFKMQVAEGRLRQLSTMGLAQEVGFRSKSTFYTAFKKIEGSTPSEYVNKHQK